MEENKCPPEQEDLERRAQALLEETDYFLAEAEKAIARWGSC